MTLVKSVHSGDPGLIHEDLQVPDIQGASVGKCFSGKSSESLLLFSRHLSLQWGSHW
jgi:hypothetical protein